MRTQALPEALRSAECAHLKHALRDPVYRLEPPTPLSAAIACPSAGSSSDESNGDISSVSKHCHCAQFPEWVRAWLVQSPMAAAASARAVSTCLDSSSSAVVRNVIASVASSVLCEIVSICRAITCHHHQDGAASQPRAQKPDLIVTCKIKSTTNLK